VSVVGVTNKQNSKYWFKCNEINCFAHCLDYLLFIVGITYGTLILLPATGSVLEYIGLSTGISARVVLLIEISESRNIEHRVDRKSNSAYARHRSHRNT